MTEKTEQEQAVIDAAIKWEAKTISRPEINLTETVRTLRDAVKAYQQSIKPKTDWSKVPYLTPIMCNGKKSYFLFVAGDTIRALEDGGDDVLFYRMDCTLIEPTYTTPVWHPWTGKGKRPEWVQDNDIVIIKTKKTTWYRRASTVDWFNEADEFMVIKEQD